jgi:hypothetical protein
MGCCKSKSDPAMEDWGILNNYIHVGESIWLTQEETIRYLKAFCTPDHYMQFEFDPFNGTLIMRRKLRGSKVEWKYTESWFDIPYTDYPLSVLHKAHKVPPGIRIARTDLWNSKLFKSWLKQQAVINKTKEVNLGKTVTNLVDGYLLLK